MKKILMVSLLLLGIGLAVGGYYMFYLKPAQDVVTHQPATPVEPNTPVAQQIKPIVPPKPDVTDYYVSPEKLGVREHPKQDAFIESVLYRGDKVHVLEKRDGWGRISPYYLYDEGQSEVAEWIPLDALLEVAPTITEQQRIATISSYIEGSDDFKLHFDVFIATTDDLIREGICTPPDFEELKGWVKSLRYEKDVYFVYCGGLKQANKIYLNAQSGKIFYQ